jgi:non-homologous end joining protein Ku
MRHRALTHDKGIRGFTLCYASEFRDAAAYFDDIPEIKLPAEMKELAEVIIDGKAGHFDPAGAPGEVLGRTILLEMCEIP